MKRLIFALAMLPGAAMAEEPASLDDVLGQLNGTLVTGEGTITYHFKDEIRFMVSRDQQFDVAPNVPFDTLVRLEQCKSSYNADSGCRAKVTGHLRMRLGLLQIVATDITFLD
ncbi:hypothetical protein [Phaeobacter sp. CAU 1743]|uniref:hypothetical protein n=1 Tax=Phaeobacter sp. CAU 1743 TaxID=3140367 RepID=UPI00325A8923